VYAQIIPESMRSQEAVKAPGTRKQEQGIEGTRDRGNKGKREQGKEGTRKRDIEHGG
jgi:hypothetical protein